MRIALFLAFTLLLAGPRAAHAADFTVPPVPHHYVTDSAGALTATTQTALENELRSYETSTGHQVIVWIGTTTGDVPLETWTTETAHAWKIGRRGQDDGAILFAFMSDHKVRIEVGYGLEGRLTDADSSRIITQRIVPAMRRGDTNAAIADGVRAILTTITPSFTGSPLPGEPTTSSSGGAGTAALVVVILAFAVPLALTILMFVLLRRTRGKSTGGRSGGGSGEWISSSGGSSSSDFSSSDDDFDAGGGDFGGGGASGSW